MTERLTEINEFGNADIIGVDALKLLGNLKPMELLQASNALDKLAHYENLEEHSRLIELPCAVGDMVYTNQSMSGWYMQKKKRPYEAKIVFIGINGIDNFFNIEFKQGMMLQFKFSDIGKTVFLTKEEAEAKLKERGEQE